MFKFLEEDIASGRMKYTSAKSLKTLYTKLTGKTSNVHGLFKTSGSLVKATGWQKIQLVKSAMRFPLEVEE